MSPQRKAMLISQAIKTFRLINKEKAYKGKECQTEEGGGGGRLKLRLTKGRNVGDQTPAEGALSMLLCVHGVLWALNCVCMSMCCVCVCVCVC